MPRLVLALVTIAVIACSPASKPVPQSKSPTNAQPQTTSELIKAVSPSVVQIFVFITDFSTTRPIPPDHQSCFALGGGKRCIVGTGFLIDEQGDVITANHVAQYVQKVIRELESSGIHSRSEIGVNVPNIDTPQLVVSSGTAGFPAVLMAADPAHDLAAYRPFRNPFNHMAMIEGLHGTDMAPTATVARLAVDRAEDGEAIFACGYPLGEAGLVTTSGNIASAWKSEVLKNAQQNGRSILTDTYWVDLRVNPGNSGGPMFRSSDHTVLGMIVEQTPSLGSVGIAVPAKYIAEFSRNLASQPTPQQP